MTSPDKTPTKTTAQQRADQIHAFQHELAELTREQVLSLSGASIIVFTCPALGAGNP